MLKYLSIKNLILIQNIEIFFQNGLCILTGETGAGKSMILDSLSLITGGRTKSSIKPEKGKKTIVTAQIDISNFPDIKKDLNKLDIAVEDDLIIKRTVSDDGKSKSFINDYLVSLSTLKQATNGVIEIHSQFSEQGLLDSSTHINTLDDYGVKKEDLIQLKNLWEQVKKIKEEYELFSKEIESLAEIKETNENDLKEINILNPLPHEFEDLEKKRKLLKNYIKISESINNVTENFLGENTNGIENLITENIKILNGIHDLLDNEAKEQIKSLESISLEISEISRYFSNILEPGVQESSLEGIEHRVSEFKRIARKHKVDENELYKFPEIIESKLSSSEQFDVKLSNIKNKLNTINNEYFLQSKLISDIRNKKSKLLDESINSEFLDLKLENAQFQTFIEKSESSSTGQDKVTFKIKTNPKADMEEIKKISSGGELCRIALAIKVTADKNKLSTLFFDEVDSGIGGAVSTAVGERLKRLGENRQVCVITHSPQVASLANNHFKVIKNQFETKLIELDYNERTTEIARMLSAKEITKEAMDAAKKLLEQSKEIS